jgi:uncharacterized protein YkwD
MPAKKSSSKSNKNTKIHHKIFGSQTRLALIVGVFSVLGIIYLIGASADQVGISYKPTDVVAARYSHKPTTATRDEGTGAITYESASNYEALLANGSIVCDDGNAEGNVRTGFIPQKRLDRLMANLEETGVGGTQGTATAATIDIGNDDMVVLNKGNNSKVLKLDRKVGKPSAADKLEKAIANACRENASENRKRDTLPAPTLPVRGKSSAVNSIPAKVANIVTPKASATVPPTAVGFLNDGFSNKMVDWTNWERGTRGIPGLTRSNCLNTAARVHAEKMMNAGSIWHSSLTGSISYCSTVGSWTRIGENVGQASGDPSVLSTAYMNSPGHAANVLNGAYKCHGHATWTRSSDNRHFHVVLFATFSNGRCN